MIIDANMYWFDEDIFTDNKLSDEFLSSIVNDTDYYGYMEMVDSDTKQIVIEKPKGFQNLNYIQHEYTLEYQLEALDRANVDKAVLKLPGCSEWLTLDMCKMFNDKLWKRYLESKGRLIPLASVNPNNSSEAEVCKELDRIKSIGFTGVQLASHYGDKYLDDERFRPFFRKVHALNLTVYIHHSPLPVDYNSFLDYNGLRRSYGRCSDQMIAVSREINSNLFIECPDLKVVHSMLGGGYFAFNEMCKPRKNRVEKVDRFASDGLQVNHLEKNIYFEMSHSIPWGEAQLACAIEVLGSNKVIFGSSYPVKEQWLKEGASYLDRIDLCDEDREKVLATNAIDVYRIGQWND